MGGESERIAPKNALLIIKIELNNNSFLNTVI